MYDEHLAKIIESVDAASGLGVFFTSNVDKWVKVSLDKQLISKILPMACKAKDHLCAIGCVKHPGHIEIL